MAVAVSQESGALTRIRFPLTPGKDGFPPASDETLWSEDLGGGLYRIDNIPFFVVGIAVGDVVEARFANEILTFQRLRKASGHSTIRVIVYDENGIADVRETFNRLGCATESMSNSRLVAIDVPPSADLARVRAELDHGHRKDRWDYEEAAIATE